VYVEKPLATTIGEGRAMVEVARPYHCVVQMGTQWRNMTHCQEAIEFVHSGKLGKIRQVRAWAHMDWAGGIGSPPDSDPPPGVNYDMWLGPAPKQPFNPNRFHSNFRWFWDYAGGLMTDWGVHLLNVVLWGMGHEPPSTIYSVGRKYLSDDNRRAHDARNGASPKGEGFSPSPMGILNRMSTMQRASAHRNPNKTIS
jgi:predicted dehydrogenase